MNKRRARQGCSHSPTAQEEEGSVSRDDSLQKGFQVRANPTANAKANPGTGTDIKGGLTGVECADDRTKSGLDLDLRRGEGDPAARCRLEPSAEISNTS